MGSGSPNLGPSAISHAVYPISFFPIGGQACPGNIYKIFSESFSSFGAEIACSCFLPLWPISKVTQCDTSECWRCFCISNNLIFEHPCTTAVVSVSSSLRWWSRQAWRQVYMRSQNPTNRGDPPWYQCHTFPQLDQGNVIGSWRLVETLWILLELVWLDRPLCVHLDPFSRHSHLGCAGQKINWASFSNNLFGNIQMVQIRVGHVPAWMRIRAVHKKQILEFWQ